jgi:hypothetical protein
LNNSKDKLLENSSIGKSELRKIRTEIIPVEHRTYYLKGENRELDLQAICLFAATGFFLDQDTYWKNEKTLKPATDYTLDKDGHLVEEKPYFKWHYSPRNIDFDTTVDEFTNLFETIVDEQIGDSTAILPLSGGLDSRSQAVALKALDKKVQSYSYSFQNGYDESGIGHKIAQTCGFNFDEFTIPQGYLWEKIDELNRILKGRSEFTHPRQMAILDELNSYSGVFSLGHWGDVLFDRGVSPIDEKLPLAEVMKKKVLKKGGMELAKELWQEWSLQGNFEDYLNARIEDLTDQIQIDNLSARTRAFKSLYWAPNWTSTALNIFVEAHAITLPYYDNRMCEFICGVPEKFLADRKIQIEYIKRTNRKVAEIVWQDHRPYNLTNYRKNTSPRNIPYRAINKATRKINELRGKSFVQRNWELQFLGPTNRANLENCLYDKRFETWMPKKISEKFLESFYAKSGVAYSHPLSILLTLSQWSLGESKFS